MKNGNNIFSFATKELSQDAVICWCVNWINYPDSGLHSLALDILKLVGQKDVSKEKIEIMQQYKNIDVLLIIPEMNRAVIIEDKTFSSEHDDQIAVYRERIANSYAEIGLTKDLDIKTVYFKTGYYNDDDKLIEKENKADFIVTGPDFLEVISKHTGKSEILDSYIEFLNDLINSYNNNGDYTKKDENGEWNLKNQSFAQYNLMRAFFPEKYWNINTDVFRIKTGANNDGRPWTHTEITEKCFFKGSKDDYSLFWRISSDIDGPYISLRRYDDYEKKDEKDVKRHKDTYDKMLNILKQKVLRREDISLDWNMDKLYDGYRANYKTSSLLRIVLDKFLDDWDNKGNQLISDVRNITKFFLEEIEKSDI